MGKHCGERDEENGDGRVSLALHCLISEIVVELMLRIRLVKIATPETRSVGRSRLYKSLLPPSYISREGRFRSCRQPSRGIYRTKQADSDSFRRCTTRKLSSTI